MGEHENESVECRSLSIDAILELLSHRERRKVLEYLVQTTADTVQVEELLEYLAEDEADRTGGSPSRARFETSLYHLHLPKLADAGIVDYDPRTQQVRYYGKSQLEEWLERIAEVE